MRPLDYPFLDRLRNFTEWVFDNLSVGDGSAEDCCYGPGVGLPAIGDKLGPSGEAPFQPGQEALGDVFASPPRFAGNNEPGFFVYGEVGPAVTEILRVVWLLVFIFHADPAPLFVELDALAVEITGSIVEDFCPLAEDEQPTGNGIDAGSRGSFQTPKACPVEGKLNDVQEHAFVDEVGHRSSLPVVLA